MLNSFLQGIPHAGFLSLACAVAFCGGCVSLDSCDPDTRLAAISECRERADSYEYEEYRAKVLKLVEISSCRDEREDVRKAAYGALVEFGQAEQCANIVLGERDQEWVSTYFQLSDARVCFQLTIDERADARIIRMARRNLLVGNHYSMIDRIGSALNKSISQKDDANRERVESLVRIVDDKQDWNSLFVCLVNSPWRVNKDLVILCLQKIFQGRSLVHLDAVVDVVLECKKSSVVEIVRFWLLNAKLTQQWNVAILRQMVRVRGNACDEGDEALVRRCCERCEDQGELRKLADGCELIYDYILDENVIFDYAMRAKRDCSKIVSRIKNQEQILELALKATNERTKISAITALTPANHIIWQNEAWIEKCCRKLKTSKFVFDLKNNNLLDSLSNDWLVRELINGFESDSDRVIAGRLCVPKLRAMIQAGEEADRAAKSLILLAEADIDEAKIAGAELLTGKYSYGKKVKKWVEELANKPASQYCSIAQMLMARRFLSDDPEKAYEWYSKAMTLGHPGDEKLRAEIRVRRKWAIKLNYQEGFGPLRWGQQMDSDMKCQEDGYGKKRVKMKDCGFERGIGCIFGPGDFIYDATGFCGVEWRGAPFGCLGADYRVPMLLRKGFDEACDNAESVWGVSLKKSHMNGRLVALGGNDHVVVTISVPDDPDEMARYLVLKR